MPAHGDTSDRVPEIRITPDVRTAWRAVCRDCDWAFTPKRAAAMADLTTMRKARLHVTGLAHRVRITHQSACEYRPVTS